MIFEMTKQQKDKLDQWKDNIEKVYGEEGKFVYSFKPNGKGHDISIYCDLSKSTLILNEDQQ